MGVSASNSTGTNMYNIASGYATSMYTGTLVEVSAGNLTILAENGANGGAAPIGVFQGCQYTALMEHQHGQLIGRLQLY